MNALPRNLIAGIAAAGWFAAAGSAQTIVSGTGNPDIDIAAVQAAVAAGISGARFSVIDSFVIPNLHEAVFPAISGTTKVEALEALGIVESFSVASLIEGADAAVLECPFDTMLNAVRARFTAMGLPSFPGAGLMVFWGGWQHGYNAFAHNPVNAPPPERSLRAPAIAHSNSRVKSTANLSAL